MAKHGYIASIIYKAMSTLRIHFRRWSGHVREKQLCKLFLLHKGTPIFFNIKSKTTTYYQMWLSAQKSVYRYIKSKKLGCSCLCLKATTLHAKPEKIHMSDLKGSSNPIMNPMRPCCWIYTEDGLYCGWTVWVVMQLEQRYIWIIRVVL